MVFVLGSLCFIYGFLQFYKMFAELRDFRQKEDPNPIFIFIPILNIIELLKTPDRVLEAKRLAGIQNPTTPHFILYWFLGLYILPNELNEVWQAASGGRPSQG